MTGYRYNNIWRRKVIEMMLSEAANKLSASLIGNDNLFKGCVTDSRKKLENTLFIALKGEHFDGHDYIADVSKKGANAVMVTREVETDLPQILVKDTKKAMGQLAAVWRDKFSIPVIGITGSNGKTTVKEMLALILQQNARVLSTQGNYNNDIGLPLTLFELNEEHEYTVLEMGANHSGEIQYLTSIAKPNVAVITQCAPAHLEGFGSIQDVAIAKAEIYQGLQNNGVAIINADDNYADYWLSVTDHYKQILFGLDKTADVYASNIQSSSANKGNQFTLHVNTETVNIDLSVAGKHNVMNALAAASCAKALNINVDQIKQGLNAFAGVAGRMQIKSTVLGSTVIDDTYNANPTSLTAAVEYLATLGDNTCLVLGDMGELGEGAESFHVVAGKQAKQLEIKTLYTVGSLAKAATKEFGQGAIHFESKSDLIDELMRQDTGSNNILVKGSRSMKMEQIVDRLTNKEINQC